MMITFRLFIAVATDKENCIFKELEFYLIVNISFCARFYAYVYKTFNIRRLKLQGFITFRDNESH